MSGGEYHCNLSINFHGVTSGFEMHTDVNNCKQIRVLRHSSNFVHILSNHYGLSRRFLNCHIRLGK